MKRKNDSDDDYENFRNVENSFKKSKPLDNNDVEFDHVLQRYRRINNLLNQANFERRKRILTQSS